MSRIAQISPEPASRRYLGPAEVLTVDAAAGTARVSLAVEGEPRAAWARIAVPQTMPLEPGDEVLVAGDGAEALFIIGLLADRGRASDSEVRAAAGARACVEGEGAAERLCVYSESNELLFEYEPAAGKGKLWMARGDLEIETREGDIRFKAARNVRLEGPEIELAARGGIRLAVVDGLRQSAASLSLGLHRLKAAAALLTLDAGRAHLNVEETRFIGKRLLGKIVFTQLVADKCETITRVLVEKSKNAYRTVEQLSQLQTGRMRTLVEETYQLTAGKAFLKSRQDFKVKADKIHLG
jgi:hypothetical protein